MAIIPGGQQIRTSSADVDLTPRGNSLVQAQNKVYTMDDIVETVNAEAGESGSDIFNQAIFYFSSTFKSWQVRELHNDTGLTFTWSSPDNKTLVGSASDYLQYEINDIYTWAVVSAPEHNLNQSLAKLTAQVTTTEVRIREAIVQDNGSGVIEDTNFSGYLQLKRMVVENPPTQQS
jgi:hypothetical protein